MARAAIEAGAKVTLIAGPVQLATPDGVTRIDVETASQMHQAVHCHVQQCDIFIATAAVADYKPGLQAVNKIKKTADEMQMKLVRTHDILSSVAALSPGPYTVGFAAETDNVLEYARAKMDRKKLDIIIANAVGPAKGFDQDDNEVDVLWPQGHIHLQQNSKTTLAQKLIKIIAERINANDTTENTGRKTR
jgi:phosphopantothenoylcysteine decarboxylase/phosphopantothenate--cysteine ligase